MKKCVRVTLVPRRLKHRSKIVPSINSERRQYEDINTRVLSHKNPLVLSTQFLECPSITTISSKRLVTNNSQQLLLTSSSFDVIGQSMKKTFPDIRKENIEKKKNYPKRCRIFIIILIILFALAAIAVGIYLIIHFKTASTSTTKTMSAILRWNTTGQTVAGELNSVGAASYQLNDPCDLAIDSLNTLYIADFSNNRIQKWLYGGQNGTTIAGKNNGSYGSDATSLHGPSGIHLDSNGNIYVADTNNNRIQYWAKDSVSGTTVAGTGISGTSNSQLNSPYHVVYDENTQILYIADFNNYRIMSYTSGASTGNLVAGGNGLGTNTTQLNLPIRFYFDSVTNSLIIANVGANNIVRWVLGDTSWTIVAGSINGSSGASSTLFTSPTGVTLDPIGNIYVADGGNSRIQMFPAGQNVGITIAGITGLHGSNATQLYSPYSVRLDDQLNLYVADTGNNRIQKFARY